ncbi:MAG: ABC transporter substrate-binding protein [Deltaproteobacteria bacterium]|nr:ABC transporter substrate-binding protein [Deltaproteobacteria bacterium]
MKYLILFLSFIFFVPVLSAKKPCVDDCKVEIDQSKTPEGRIKAFQQLVKLKVKKKMSKFQRNNFYLQLKQYFAFEIMAKAALYKTWNKINAEQKQKYVQLFTKMIQNSYTKKLQKHKKYKISFKNRKIIGKRAKLTTTLNKVNGKREDQITVAYKMLKTSSEWKVYDVVTDEVSLIRNYRSTYVRLINKGGFPKVIKYLEKVVKN